GVSLCYYGNAAGLEFDFIVEAGADPRPITIAFDGAENIRIDESGDLVLRIRTREIRQHRPFVYQRDGTKTIPVAGGYRLLEQNRVGFVLGDYDPQRTLVLDPVLSYST